VGTISDPFAHLRLPNGWYGDDPRNVRSIIEKQVSSGLCRLVALGHARTDEPPESGMLGQVVALVVWLKMCSELTHQHGTQLMRVSDLIDPSSVKKKADADKSECTMA